MLIPLPDLAATEVLGRRIAAALRPGDVVALSGGLGAGKTTLVRGVARGMGVQGVVASPTFVLSRRYAGAVPLVHCDAYRLGPDDDFADVVSDPEDVVVVVEWGDPVMAALADSWLSIDIERPSGAGGEDRMLMLRGVGAEWDDGRVAELLERLAGVRGTRG